MKIHEKIDASPYWALSRSTVYIGNSFAIILLSCALLLGERLVSFTIQFRSFFYCRMAHIEL